MAVSKRDAAGKNIRSNSAQHLGWGLPLLESQVVALQLPEEPAKELQKIGAVATRSGVSVKTIRFYCDQGLLQPSGRSEGRYRLFDESVDSDLALIRTLRGLDIPLTTITAVLKSLHAEINGLLSTWQRCGGRPAQVSAGN